VSVDEGKEGEQRKKKERPHGEGEDGSREVSSIEAAPPSFLSLLPPTRLIYIFANLQE